MNRRLGHLIVIAAPLISTQAVAAGFSLEQQNAQALGMAYAGAEAVADDGGFAFYNPAAIGRVEGLDISMGATALIADSTYENASGLLFGTVPTGGMAAGDGALNNAFLPNLAIAYRASGEISLGLSVTAPFGLHSEYAPDSAIRYHALETRLATVSLNPTIAFNITPDVTVGGALRIQYLDARFSNSVDAAGIFLANGGTGLIPGTDDLTATLEATDLAVGYQLGVQADLSANTSAGLSFLSKVTHDFEGDASFGTSASLAGQALTTFGLFLDTEIDSSISTPASLSAGISHKLAPALAIKASAKRTFWHSFDTIHISFDNPAQPDEVLTQDWKDVWAFSVGTEYDVTARTSLRAGVMFDQSPVNDALASSRIQDNDRFWIHAGASHRVNKRISVDAGLGYVFVDERQIDQSPIQPENLARGGLLSTHDTGVFTASIRLRYQRQ